MGLDDSFHEGLKAYREGNYQEAVGLLNKSVTANEKNHKAWNALGVTYAKMGQVEDALTCYENALKYDPGNLSYEQNRDQIVKTAYKQIPVSKSAPPAELNLNYGRFLIPAVILLFIVICVIYVVFTPSFLGGTPTSSTGSTTPVQMNTSTENLTLSDSSERV
ncbi:MAG: tetratricopeptide repeat protein, partial [Methanospirillum sp.]|uniref:tetratricopeptide repeat protein n=1 Tax=Methanospirillum sp. TaxID=45200 RepID=UPI00236D5775